MLLVRPQSLALPLPLARAPSLTWSVSVQAVLTRSREQVSEELLRLQRDNDSLQGKHSLHVALQQAEGFILPDSVEVRGCRPLALVTSEPSLHPRDAGTHKRLSLPGPPPIPFKNGFYQDTLHMPDKSPI